MNLYRAKANIKGKEKKLLVIANSEDEAVKEVVNSVKENFGVDVDYKQCHSTIELLPLSLENE